MEKNKLTEKQLEDVNGGRSTKSSTKKAVRIDIPDSKKKDTDEKND